jgi:hypothetical protein
MLRQQATRDPIMPRSLSFEKSPDWVSPVVLSLGTSLSLFPLPPFSYLIFI